MAQAYDYEIRVAEMLDSHWQVWFLEVEIVPCADSLPTGTILRAAVKDQAALFGLLSRVRDLNLTLLEVRRIEVEADGKNG